MATRRRTTTTTGRSAIGWLKFFSFLAVMLLGLALTLVYVFGKIDGVRHVAAYIQNIAFAIALIVPMWLSYFEAWKKSTVWRVLWIIAIVLIIVFYILRFF